MLRVIIELENETVLNVNSEIGYLHRGTEKLSEYSEYYKILPFFDRMDYTGLTLCEHAYILNVEKLLNKTNNFYVIILRSLLNELMRISSHLLALTTSAMDVGAITPFLWAFEEREEIASLFENLTGSRIHTALFKKEGLNFSINKNDLFLIKEIIIRIKIKLVEIYELLSNSSIWKIRMGNVGIVPYSLVLKNGLSGPLARSTGYTYDMRLLSPYESFQFINLPISFGSKGDNLTRFYLRLEEIFNSLQYIDYLLVILLPISNNKPFSRDVTMESIIQDFKNFSEGYNIKSNKSYLAVESPKGEFGVTIISSNRSIGRPFRLKVRSPGFYNLSSLNAVCSNYLLSDLLSYLSTLDLILGEVDR